MQHSSHPSRRSFLKKMSFTGLAASLNAVPVGAAEQAAQKGLVFLFQGDSITDGNRGRNTDPNHVMGHGYAFAVASRVGADFYKDGHSFYNRGISGNKIPDLAKRWQADAIDLKPDVLSVLIGINDVAAVVEKRPEAVPAEDFFTGYRKLLQDSRAANPDLLLVLGLPFVYPVGKRKDNWELWQSETLQRADVVKKLAAEFQAVVVDYPAVFNKAIRTSTADYWIWDGIHPTIFGHELMAREWIRQVGARLTFLGKQYKPGSGY